MPRPAEEEGLQTPFSCFSQLRPSCGLQITPVQAGRGGRVRCDPVESSDSGHAFDCGPHGPIYSLPLLEGTVSLRHAFSFLQTHADGGSVSTDNGGCRSVVKIIMGACGVDGPLSMVVRTEAVLAVHCRFRLRERLAVRCLHTDSCGWRSIALYTDACGWWFIVYGQRWLLGSLFWVHRHRHLRSPGRHRTTATCTSATGANQHRHHGCRFAAYSTYIIAAVAVVTVAHLASANAFGVTIAVSHLAAVVSPDGVTAIAVTISVSCRITINVRRKSTQQCGIRFFTVVGSPPPPPPAEASP